MDYLEEFLRTHAFSVLVFGIPLFVITIIFLIKHSKPSVHVYTSRKVLDYAKLGCRYKMWLARNKSVQLRDFLRKLHHSIEQMEKGDLVSLESYDEIAPLAKFWQELPKKTRDEFRKTQK